jgi:hypothetical protein
MGPQYSNDFEECTRYFRIWIRILKPDQYCRLVDRPIRKQALAVGGIIDVIYTTYNRRKSKN